MSTLEAINYIHTLFLYELCVPLEAAHIVRFCIQTKFSLCNIYYTWIEKRIIQNTLPNFCDYLFENERDMELFKTWYFSNDFNKIKPNIRYLSLRPTYNGFRFAVQGVNDCFEMILSQYKLQQYSTFLQNFTSISTSESFSKYTRENEFYKKLEDIFNVLTSTNKIPFELVNVK